MLHVHHNYDILTPEKVPTETKRWLSVGKKIAK